MSLIKSVSLTVAAIGLLSLPASADWGRCYYGGSRVSIGIGLPLFAPAYYPAPYYYCPRPVYYEPAPVVVGREVRDNLVLDAQRVLARKGYYNGTVDGALGPQSRAAIRAWQIDCHLAVTGQLDVPTLRSLALL